jgi:RHS repeat-associated protein
MKKLRAAFLLLFVVVPGWPGQAGQPAGLPAPFQGPVLPGNARIADGEEAELKGLIEASWADPKREALAQALQKGRFKAWQASLWLDLGHYYYRHGYFSRSLDAFEQAWKAGAKDPKAARLADRAGTEYARMLSRVGEKERLRELLKELSPRPMQGLASRQRRDARDALRSMEQRPEISFRCGPLAIESVLRSADPGRPVSLDLRTAGSPSKGFSLGELEALSAKVQYPMVAVRRQAGAAIPVPSVVHWKLGHYSAVIGQRDGLYHLTDPTFLDDHWVSLDALEDESSGYFMVPAGARPDGFLAVDAESAAEVRGKGVVSDVGDLQPPCEQVLASGCGGCPDGAGESGGGGGGDCGIGMPWADMDLNLTALKLVDTPLLHEPTLGPRVKFTLSYHDRAYIGHPLMGQAPNFPVIGSGLSGHWSHSFRSYQVFDHGPSGYTGMFMVRGGGSGAKEPAAYVDLFSGWREEFELVSTEYVFNCPSPPPENYPTPCVTITRTTHRLHRLVDPQGLALVFGYEGPLSLKLTSITDAAGGVTTFHYDDTDFPDLVTRVVAPGGRYAQMAYDTQGRLVSIRDAVGLSSSFTYNTVDLDLLDSMTTLYGTTTFDREDDEEGRNVVVTDPLGGKRKARFAPVLEGLTDDSPVPAPGTVNALSHILDKYRNVAYWDEKAMNEGPSDPNKAVIYHFQYAADSFNSRLGALLESVKRPLENRVHFSYEGQSVNPAHEDGIVKRRPNRIGTVLDDGSTQFVQIDRNDKLKVTKFVDPAGRETHYEYAANQMDLLFVRNKNNEVLASFEYNGPPQRPTKVIDAGGKETLLGYNGFGQLTSVQLPTGESTSLIYGSNGFLEAIIPPAPGTRVDFTPDPMGRIGSSTDQVNGTLEYEYDDLNRLTKVTYPDNTYEQIAYDRLDVDTVRDRNGLVTDYSWTAMRRLQSVLDPANRLTQLGWCECGALNSLTDPEGSVTTWDYDLQGRLKTKTYHDNSKIHYTYEAKSSRLKKTTDAMGQETHFTYDISDRLTNISYQNALVPTASVAFVYDSVFGRLQSMTDGTGQTSFGYHPIPAGSGNGLGAGRLATVDGPLGNDTISYLYDASGRMQSVAVNGVAESMVYNQGRLQSITNPLGTFTHAYDGVTGLLDSVTYPGGKLELDYHTTNQDKGRLKDITHYNPALQLLARHGYSYDPSGRITTWEQRPQSGPGHDWVLGYDNAGQLSSGQKLEGGTTTQLQMKDFTYDKAGNRTKDTTDGIDTDFTPNNLNQLTQVQPKGPLLFQGRTNQPAAVEVEGQAAGMDAEHVFSTQLPLASSVVQISVTAQTPGGQVITQHYEVKRDRDLVYDLNGNLINDGQRTYTWDAANRLVKVSVLDPTTGLSSRTSEFTYDGLWRRVRILEKQGVSTVADRRFVWNGAQIAEERDSSNAVQKRFYGMGVQQVSGAQAGSYYYQRDHLGSVVAALNASGVEVARYDFDLWGKRTKLSGTFDLDMGYTGHFQHEPSGLALALYRGYSPSLGRWLNRDPIGEKGGMNLYEYAGNSPGVYYDPYGLFNACGFGEALFGIGINGLGMIGGVGLMAAPTGVSQVIGLGVFARSTYGFGAGFANLWGSLWADTGAPNLSQGSLVKDAAALAFGNSPNVMALAHTADLGLDLITIAGGAAAMINGPVGISGNPFGPAFSMRGFSGNPTDLGKAAALAGLGDLANGVYGTGRSLSGNSNSFMGCGK